MTGTGRRAGKDQQNQIKSLLVVNKRAVFDCV